MLKKYKDLKREIKNVNNFKDRHLKTVYWTFEYFFKKMLPYCLKCRNNAESKNPKVGKTKNGRIKLLSKWVACNSKKSKFIKVRETSR